MDNQGKEMALHQRLGPARKASAARAAVPTAAVTRAAVEGSLPGAEEMVVAAAPWATKRAGEGKDLVLPSAVMVVVVASTPSISCCVAWMWAVVRRSRHRPTHQSRPARREVPTALPPPARPLRQLPPQARVARSRCCWSRVLLHTSHHMRLVRRRDRSGVSPPMHPPPSGHPILRWPFPRHHCPSPWHGPLPRWQYVRPWVWCSSRRRRRRCRCRGEIGRAHV